MDEYWVANLDSPDFDINALHRWREALRGRLDLFEDLKTVTGEDLDAWEAALNEK